MLKSAVVVLVGLAFVSSLAFKSGASTLVDASPIDTNKWPAKFGFGRAATKTEVDAWDIDVRPDGKGLPPGQGSASKGHAIYVQKCVACHGDASGAQAGAKLLGPVLIGDTVIKTKLKTIGNYWPYATTLFDYIRRAMPYPEPGSLTNTEVYSLTAYLLKANHVTADTLQNAKTLPKVLMPAKKLFVFDDRKGGAEVK